MMESRYSDRLKDFDENYKLVTEKIYKAAEKAGRSPQEITLLAATKTVPPEVIRHAVAQGIICIGENRVQEFLEKYEELRTLSCDLQFIGRLQTNKIKYLLRKVSCIQSVDSLKLASEISRLCVRENTHMNVLIEVNIGREESKGGIFPEALLELVDQVRELPGITVHGLMAIPPDCGDPSRLFQYFSSMRQYYVDIAAKKLDNVFMDCLSMGMSSDFPAAIECGATMVRVGSALFGKRG